MKSVLVTGGSGYFGRGFVARCLADGVQRVCVYSRDEAKHAAMRAEMPDERLRFFVGDVRDRWRLQKAMEGVEVVVHAAALKRVEVGEYCADEMVKTNVVGTMNVVEAAQAARVDRVVFLSTDKACEPVNAYGASKLLAEKVILAANNSSGRNGPKFAVTRYGNVAGSTGSVIPTWRAAHAAGRALLVRNPSATRFWMTLDEAVDLVMQTIETAAEGGVRVPDLPAYRLGDLFLAMNFPHSNIVFDPNLGPGEKLHESMLAGQSSEAARRMSVAELQEGLANV